MNTLTLLSGHWMPSRLRYPLLFLLPLLLVSSSLFSGAPFLPVLPVSQAPLAHENPVESANAARGANLVATDRLYPLLSDELEIREQLSRGEWPLWNSKAGLGSPLAAGSLSAPWNPLRWPFLLFDPALAGGLHAILSLVLAGLGMMMFLEGRGLKYTAAMFGALAFQSCGFLVANLHYVMKVDAAIWAPWCLWGVDLVYRGRKNAGLIVFAGMAMSALSGFPQVFLFVAVLTLAWIFKRALEAIRVDGESGDWKASLVAALLFAGLGGLAGSVHLYPMWEASAESTRQAQAPQAIGAQSLPHAALLSTVLPTVFGDPTELRPAPRDAATWWLLGSKDLERGLNANRLEWHLFVGVTVLALVLSGVLAKTRRALFPALVVLGACGFLFAWPLFDSLYGLPGANLGAPARAAPIAFVGLAWLAALGFDALLEGQGAARLGALFVAVSFGLFALVLWLTIQPSEWAAQLEGDLVKRFSVDPELVRSFFTLEDAARVAERILESAKSLMLICALVIVLAIYAGRLTVRGSGVAGCALLVFEATVAGLPQTSVPEPVAAPLFPESAAIAAIAEAAGDGRVLRIDASPSGVDDVLWLARPNLLQVYGVKDLTPYGAFPSARLHDLWTEFEPEGTYRGGVASLRDPAKLDAPLLDALRVTCVLSRNELEHPRLQLRYSAPEFFVYARSGALDPARVVPELLGGNAAQVAAPSNDFAAAAWAELGRPSVNPDRAFEPGVLRVSRPDPTRIDVSLNNSSGGFLVLHDAWAPGWRATIGGKPTRVLRLDHVFLGVEVPAASSLIQFTYEPTSFRVGAWVSLLSLLLTLLLTRGRHRGRQRRAASLALQSNASSGSR